MTVVELWNACVDWFAGTTVVVCTDGGDDLMTFVCIEDCLKRCANNMVSAFSVDTINDTITIEIEV